MAPPGGRNRWYFSDQELANSPSRRCGVSADKEESYRQQAANFIQDMGQRLQVTQLCINTAIVYMQRFYMFHSFTKFHRNFIAAAALFLAAKVEEQPRKLEHVIKVSHVCLNRDQPHLDSKSEKYLEQAQELVSNENILLQTLGFDVAIDHPHTHVVKCCQLVKAHKELAQTSYFMATNSLHLTTMCLRYPPTIVACVCIHLACNWSKYEIPVSAHGKAWFSYVDNEARLDQIQTLTREFLAIFEKCPSRLKKKILQSHNDTKAQEDLRRKENTQNDQYRIDFGDGQSSIVSMQTQHNLSIQPGNPLAGGSQAPKNTSGSSSSASGSAPGSASASHSSSKNYHPKPQSKPDGRSGPPQAVSGQTKQHHYHGQVKGQPGQPGYSRPSSASSAKHVQDKAGRTQSHGEDQQRQGRREQIKPSHSQMFPVNSRSMSSSSLPPPYPSHGQHVSKAVHPPAQHSKPPHISTAGLSSMPRSIFDLSPDKSARPEKPPPPVGPIQDPLSGFHEQPSYPHHQSHGGHQAPPPNYNSSLPSYPSTSHSLPPYPKPGEPPFQPPQTISPIRDNPSLAINRQKSMEPGELDTPTPTHIANMFNFPSSKQNYSNQQNLVQSKAKDDRSLHSILGFSQTTSDNVKHPDQSRSQSKLEKVLFDDFDDVPMSSVSNMPLPSAPTISNQHVKKNDSVSGLSDLFGEDSDSSSFLSTLTQSQSTSSQSASFSGSLQALADIPKNENNLIGMKTESPQVRGDEMDKRRTSGSLLEKKARSGKSGLFSPSPPHDSKHDLSSLISPLKQEHEQMKRNRTTSSSSNNDAIVNVQKLENLAPEFQAFKGISGSASILVGADGLPSPSKVKKESLSSPLKERKTAAEEKRRSTSGHNKERSSIAEGSQKSPEEKSKEKALEDKKDHKKKKEKKEKKDKKEKKHKKDKKRDDESKEMKDEERKHKKEKKKSKDKDKERERKLKILPVAQSEPGAGVGGDQSAQGPLKLKIKLVKNEAASNTKKDNRKRDRSASSAKLDKFEVPAAKMARATGSDRNQEAKFLEESFKKKEKR